MSNVWKHALKQFNPITKRIQGGKCKRCGDVIKCKDGQTTTLRKHIESHDIDIDEDDGESSRKVQIVNPSIRDYLKRKSLNEIVASLAIDGVSIRAITNSKYIRESISRDGFKLPRNESDVMRLIHDDFADKKAKMVEEIGNKKANGTKFSITYDEYTSLARKRYIGVNIHDSTDHKTYKTGIIRVIGSCPAEIMLANLSSHLQSFGLSLENDIVASTQDGAAVNKKTLSMTELIQQFCLNHAIHLGVVDTLYKKNGTNIREAIDLEIDDEENDIDNYAESNLFESFEEPEDSNIDYFEVNIRMQQTILFLIHFFIKQVLKAARKVVKFIKMSAVRNDIFQAKVKQEFGRNIELHLDVRHRWNSIFQMIDPLLKTKKCLFETFNELNAVEEINQLDIESLKALRDAMEPIKISVEALSREDSTLDTATTIIDFMLNKLVSYNTAVSNDLHVNLKKRIDERINKDVMNLIKSLKDPAILPSKNTLSFASGLAKRLFGAEEAITQADATADVGAECSNENQGLSLQEELNTLLKNGHMCSNGYRNTDFKWIRQEFLLYKNTGKRTDNLEKLFDCMMTIKPTSTDVERIFSTCSNFCTKVRSRLSDTSLGALVFLKFYYNNV
jgi:hypothetical protein